MKLRVKPSDPRYPRHSSWNTGRMLKMERRRPSSCLLQTAPPPGAGAGSAVPWNFGENCTPLEKEGRDMSTVAVVGLGYVALPLAAAFGRKFRTIGFDLTTDK